jgi:hypothetical protein
LLPEGTGEPQTLQKTAPSEITAPHFGQDAIVPPISIRVGLPNALTQKPF